MIQGKSDFNNLINEISFLKDNLSSIDQDKLDSDILHSLDKVKQSQGLDKLTTMPVDTLTVLEKGLPINYLVNHGYLYIADLKNKSIEELMMIEGVGPVYAELIYHAVKKIVNSVKKETQIRIDPDQLSENELELLNSIYLKSHLLTQAEYLLAKIKDIEHDIQPLLKTLEKKRGIIGSFFQSKETKEAITQAFTELNKVLNRHNYHEIQQAYDALGELEVDPVHLKEDFVKNNALYYTEIEQVTGAEQSHLADDLPSEILERVKNFPLNTEGLKVTLRKYQDFGARYALYNKRTLLGDEMGLGKTIQGLAMINHLFQANKRHSIVVCPLSVLPNWKREIEKHSDLKTYVFHGKGREAAYAKWQEQSGVLITTYEHTLRLEFNSSDQLHALIVDEAHYIKNPEANRSKSVYRLAELAEYALFMSGTPLENRLEEMEQLISVLQPEIAENISEELSLLHPVEFKQAISSVYLRRNRDEVLTELPELEVIEQWVNFGEAEAAFYEEAVLNGQLMKMRRAAFQGKTPDQSPKLARLIDICNNAQENGQKVIVFSFFRDVLETVSAHLKDRTFEAITGDVPNQRRQEIIDDFSKAEPGSVLISQIIAGGVGLNIQAANIVILCEPQWKPSIEEQAISRAYRMGQSRNVVVYRLLTEESIDLAILEILGNKSHLFDLYARESEIADRHLNKADDLDEDTVKKKVLEFEKERLKAKNRVG